MSVALRLPTAYRPGIGKEGRFEGLGGRRHGGNECGRKTVVSNQGSVERKKY